MRLDSLASDILYADSGWAPISAVQAIREDVIEGLCKLDDSLIGLASGLEEAARKLRDCVAAGDARCIEEKLRAIEEAVGKLREVLATRKEYLRFATSGGRGEDLSEAVSSLWRAARSLVSRLLP